MSQDSYYYVPSPSHWPLVGSLALLLMGSGAAMWVNHIGAGPFLVLAGFVVLIVMMKGWFGVVISESEGGSYNQRVDISFRWAMSWFIFSEVMFFSAFFGALFYVRALSVPDLGSVEQQMLWPDFKAAWPSAGPAFKEAFTPMAAWGIPAINTLLLLSSGVTLTWAHWGLLKDNRTQLKLGLLLTIVLGLVFLSFQVYEYSHAYHEMNLKLSTGVYGTTFFMLTGFHGLHVTIGATMLIVMLFRVMAGHFKPDHHFAFEGVAWYWHFVDVVWLFLFVVVYWL
ncbi:MAG: cytochrome c oxidase subunit 3 [Rhodocyclaceae bacterium]|nr:MAG: cytochrome c oxidase subunit 3 [Rhodocyclaceae bacterium]